MAKIKQPKDVTLFNGDLKLRLKWNPAYASQMNKSMHLVQIAIDNEVIKQMGPYTPMQTGTLMRSATLGTVVGSGKIVQSAPYSRYLYYGEVYGPNIPIVENGQLVGFWSPPSKSPTGRALHYNTAAHPLAGKLWFERMKADKKDVIQRAAEAAGGIK